MEHYIPDFWLAGRLITAAANLADVAELFDLDFAELFDLAELLERVDLADLVVSDLVDKALEGFEDWALLARLLLAEVSEPELLSLLSESLILIYNIIDLELCQLLFYSTILCTTYVL